LPLHTACRKVKKLASDSTEAILSPLETIKLFVEPWPESLQIKMKPGMLPLHWVCFDPVASTDMICYLVELSPATVSMKDYKGQLPLHLACTQTMGDPLLEVIQCLVQAWPESIHILQGNDKSDSDSDDDSDEFSEDSNESGDHKFDGMQALALDLVCMAFTSKEQAQPLPELLLLLTNDMPPLHFACALTWIPTWLTMIQYLCTTFSNDWM